MAVTLSPHLTVFYEGSIADSATIDVYQSGTTTRVTTYSNGTYLAANTNPIVCNTNGEATIYVNTSTALRMVFKTSGGATIRDLDPIYINPDLSGLTASVAELNILDGATLSTAELNILDGVTATAAELNTLDGITASTAELNTMDGVTASTADLNKTSKLSVKGSDIASAATADLSAATGDFVDVTGTTTITSFGTASTNVEITVRFTGALTLTHNATSLQLPGSANITTAAGDVGKFRSLGSGNWKCASFQKADGSPISGGAPFSDASAISKNSSDSTKQVKLRADNITTATTRSIYSPDADIDLGAVAQNNLIINGGLDYFQRVDPTILTNSISNNAYCADRWKVLTQTTTIQGGRTTGDRAKNAIRLTQNQASAQRFGMIQHLENLVSYPCRSKTVIGQFRIKSSSGNTVRAAIVEWTGTADTPTTNVVNSWTNSTFTTGNFFIATTTTITATGSVTPSASTWTDLTVTGTVSASANNVALFVWTDSAEAQNVTLDITQVGLYLANTQQPWQPEPVAKELAACQRFYSKSYLIDTKPASSGTNATLVTGAGSGSTTYHFSGTYHVKLIASPTLTLYDGAGNANKFTNVTLGTNNNTVNTVTGGTCGFMGYGGSGGLSNVQGSNYAADADF